MQLDLFVAPERTLAGYCSRWDAAYNGAPWVSDRTARLRRGHLRLYVLPRFGAYAVDQITSPAVNDWQEALLSRGISVGYAKHVSVSFSAVLAQACRDGLIQTNPVRGLRWPRRNSERPDPYTATEVRRMLRWFKRWKVEYLPLVGLVCLAGLRPSEACGLRWSDVDLGARSLKIERSAVDRVEGEPKTRRSRRRIRLTLELVEILRSAERRGPWVCTTPAGEQVSSGYWGGFHWRVACQSAGVRYRGFYRGRSAFMTQAAQRGANLLALSEYSGTSMRMLDEHYLRWLRVQEVPGERRRRRHA
jgi:hypothetical protein